MRLTWERTPGKGLESCSGFGDVGTWGVAVGGGSWGSLWLTVSPPDLQGQQPVVVGDSVLASREEARIESRVIFVPVETRWSVAGSVVLSRKDQSILALDSNLSFVLLTHSCDLGQHFPCSEPQLSSSVR